MSTKFRNVLGVIVAAAVLAASAAASAGVVDKAASKLREQKSEQRSEQKSSKSSDKGSVPSTGQGRNAQPQRDDRVRGNASGQSQPPRTSGRDSRDDNGNRDGSRNGNGNRDRGPGSTPGSNPNQGQGSSRDLHDDLNRLYGNRGNDRDRDHDHDGNHGGNDHHDGHNHRPPRYVDRLPVGYRDYYWNGDRYYVHGGHWYRPYGSSFVTVGIPFGLFVATLPGLYTSVWVDGTRYYYADHTYYVYEPVRRGYVVTRSPYGDDEDYDYDDDYGDDLYVYPARGQSEQLQADDRYQCHRWAVDQSRYDPLDDEYDADKRADYRRAITACLTGRGYTVN